jgi:hypothetical protein
VYSSDQFEPTESTSPSHHVDETDELDDVLTGIDQTTLAMQDLLSPEVFSPPFSLISLG